LALFTFIRLEKIAAVHKNSAADNPRRRPVQTDDGGSESSLTRAGLADQSHPFAGA
jgi:hypothetical protein